MKSRGELDERKHANRLIPKRASLKSSSASLAPRARTSVEALLMNRLVLGVLCGVAFGMIDVLMSVFGNHPDRNTSMLLQAFPSRFAIGFLGANLSLRMPPVLAGAIAGLLISLPDAFALHSHAGVLGTGLIFGALAGCATKRWAT